MYPYFDRGLWVWGDVLNKTLTWNLSAWTGDGLELDYKKGDIDDHKDIVARIFFSPFGEKDIRHFGKSRKTIMLPVANTR